jgi:hypothetical protein
VSKKICKAIVNIRPDLGDLDGYFYFKPVGHVLAGFVCEARPDGTYIVPYLFPLYTGERELHLTFGEPLSYPESRVALAKDDERTTARLFVATMERHEARMRALQDLDAFAKYVESVKPLENPWIRRGYAFTLILLNRPAEAEIQLQMLRGLPGTANYPGFDVAIEQVAAQLVVSFAAARETLLGWEAETKMHFRLS